jgi:hypothetical protein
VWHREVAERVNAGWQYSSETNYIFFSFLIFFILTNTLLNDAVTQSLINYMLQKLSLLHWQC